jgi:hypothetical protein
MDEPGHSDAAPLVFDLGPRWAWGWLTLGVSLLTASEAIAAAAITDLILPAPLAIALNTVVLVPTVLILMAIASALSGRIVLDSQYLRLHFGLLGGAQVLRADIVHAERLMPLVIAPIGLGIDIPLGSSRLTVTRGGQVPYVRVFLGRPVEVRRALWRRGSANELVMGTKVPEKLIAALA